ncbi:MAG: YjjG family noncanonical pyrimidine nucleotidase [Bacteroidota bacterium]
MAYKHLFFDLDHTIWDFDENQIITLKQLFKRYELGNYFQNFDDFFEKYKPINKVLWQQFQDREITQKEVKTGRFYHTFKIAGLDNIETAEAFGKDFMNENSLREKVIPYTFELLDYLKQKRYHLYIITNGFKEAQYTKMEKSGLSPYFKNIFISEDIGISKPHRGFFEHSLTTVNARKSESLVIGDSLCNDIMGAKNFGIDHVYFNPGQIPHSENVFKEIASLKELIGWL